MLKNKYVSLLLVLLFNIMPHNFMKAHQRLSDLDFESASVLPFFDHDNKKYFILSREARGKPESKGTYDDFGGSRDPGENHPVISAAREFFEEAMVPDTINMDLPHIKKFIDVNGGNTMFIIAFGHNVTFIVDFNFHAKALFNNFYTARSKLQTLFDNLTVKKQLATDPKEKRQLSRQMKKCWVQLEKDSLAIVSWDMLKAVVAQSIRSAGVTIDAAVLNPKDLKWYKERIMLRPYFVKKLRPFFADKPYEVGKNKKIRFYKQEVQQSTQEVIQESRWQKFWNWIKSYSPIIS